jgi:hypothetical protein
MNVSCVLSAYIVETGFGSAASVGDLTTVGCQTFKARQIKTYFERRVVDHCFSTLLWNMSSGGSNKIRKD